MNTLHPGVDSPNSNGLPLSGFPASIETPRFILRELSVSNVTDRYLEWLSDPEAQKWITAAGSSQRLADLKDYVLQRVGRADVLFLGIFEKSNDVHIGNIKYEPVLPNQGSAVMGVLIGDPSFRGKGVFREVFVASSAWLKKERRMERIYLGVESANEAAVKAYKSAGFVQDLAWQDSNNSESLRMICYV